jgi:cytochrome P450
MTMNIDTLPEVPGADRVFGHLRALRTDRLRFFEAAREVGPLAQLRLLGRRFLALNSPQAAYELLVEHGKATRKSPGLRLLLTHLGGEGLFMSEGELWRRQRRLMAPLFQPANLDRYAQVMTQAADAAASRWADGPVDLAAEMTRVTMAIVGNTLFGSEAFDGASDIAHAITEVLDWVNDNVASPALVGQVTVLELTERFRGGLDRLPQGMRARVDTALRTPFLVPNAFSPRLSAAKATLDTRLLALISERRKNPVARDDLLSRLLAAHDADGASMSDEQLRDESVTLFVAGHETTANALSWCFALLARHPEVRARLQAEVDALGGRAPGFHDVMRVPLAVRVFKEALRLYPPLTLLVRQAMEDFTITGVHIPKKQILFVPTWSLHRNPEVWPEPERFDPDRFLPEREAGRHRAAWLPFGLGQRVCIGNHFAMLEGPLVLTRLLQLVDFELDPTHTIAPDDFATLRPRGGVWARVRRKASAAA